MAIYRPPRQDHHNLKYAHADPHVNLVPTYLPTNLQTCTLVKSSDVANHRHRKKAYSPYLPHSQPAAAQQPSLRGGVSKYIKLFSTRTTTVSSSRPSIGPSAYTKAGTSATRHIIVNCCDCCTGATVPGRFGKVLFVRGLFEKVT